MLHSQSPLAAGRTLNAYMVEQLLPIGNFSSLLWLCEITYVITYVIFFQNLSRKLSFQILNDI